jgi:hypothetical protein
VRGRLETIFSRLVASTKPNEALTQRCDRCNYTPLALMTIAIRQKYYQSIAQIINALLRITPIFASITIILLGLIMLLLPIPLEALLIVIGATILIGSSETAAEWVKTRRARNPRLHNLLSSAEKRLPGKLGDVIRPTSPYVSRRSPSARSPANLASSPWRPHEHPYYRDPCCTLRRRDLSGGADRNRPLHPVPACHRRRRLVH